MSMWIWSGHAFASIISIPFCWHNLLNISPISALISRYITCLRYFGANTMWYWHLHFVCSKLFMSFSVMEKTSSIFFVRLADLNFNLSGSSFFVHSLSFFIPTGIASGCFCSQNLRLSRRHEEALEGHETDNTPKGAPKRSATRIADSGNPWRGIVLCLGFLATRKRDYVFFEAHLIGDLIFF